MPAEALDAGTYRPAVAELSREMAAVWNCRDGKALSIKGHVDPAAGEAALEAP
jgi:hypothetical protein